MGALQDVFDKAARELVPLSVHFDLTYRCHHRCVHCYIPEAWRQGEGRAPELTTAQVKGILDQLAAAGTFFLTFSGGEIFLRPDILSIVEYSRGLNFSTCLMTTGTMGLAEETLDFLADLGIETMMFSLYSLNPEVHDGVTGVPGSWRMTWETMERCKSRGIRVVFNTMVFTSNYADIVPLKEFTDQADIHLRLDSFLIPGWDGIAHGRELAINEDLREKLQKALGADPGEIFDREPITGPLEAGLKTCAAGTSLCYINTYGEIWPCMDVPYCCGNLTQGDEMGRIWKHSPVLRQIRHLQQQLAQDKVRLCDRFSNTDLRFSGIFNK
jgi:MoaA/NifB/PqqE/SkfB family radical SAM enzyme